MQDETATNSIVGPFLLNNEMEYAADVRVSLPTMTPGEAAEQQFVVVFRHIAPEERAERMRNYERQFTHALNLTNRERDGHTLTEEEQAIVRDTPTVDLAMLRDALVRIESGVVNSGGHDISKEPSTRDAVLRNQWARQGVWKAYLASMRARDSLGN